MTGGLPNVQAVSVGPHVFQADEPVEAGGGDEFIAPLVPNSNTSKDGHDIDKCDKWAVKSVEIEFGTVIGETYLDLAESNE